MSQEEQFAKVMQVSGQAFTKTYHNDTYSFIKPEQFDLSGKAVLVTGASRGIGRATATSFAKAGASLIALGARSALADTLNEVRSAASAAGRPEPKVLALDLDVSDQASVERAAHEVERAFGRLDVLVNNAGYSEVWAPVVESKVEDWWGSYEVNVKGVYLCCRAFLPLMLKGEVEGGLKTVVNVVSMGAHLVMPGVSGYQTTKLAITRFGEFLTAEYGQQGLLAYSVHPGAVATQMADKIPEAMRAYLVDSPGLPADSMVWLAAERREWLAGRYVSANWDMQELVEKKEKVVEGDLLKVRLATGLE